MLIVGNVRTGTETIERELQIKPGDPLSEAAKIESQRRLAALGLFRRVQIAELAHGDETRRDLLVTVEEAPVDDRGRRRRRGRPAARRSAARRGGVASEQFDLAPRGFFEIGRRNLFGKNRSISLFTSVSLSLKDSQVFGDAGTPTISSKFPEYRVLGTYREPRLFNTAADAFLTGTHRAADSIQLQLRAAASAAPSYGRRLSQRDQRQRQLSDSAHRASSIAGDRRKTSR